MVKLHHPPGPQSSALLHPAEVRNQIWHLLFADSEVVSQGWYIPVTSPMSKHSSGSGHTKIVFNDCVPAPNPAGLDLQFAAYAPCRKLISRMEINFVYSMFGRSQDFRGGIDRSGTICGLPDSSCGCSRIGLENADSVEADKLLLRELSDWISSSDYNTKPFIKGHHIKDLVLHRNRKYRISLNFMVTLKEFVTAFPRVKHYKRVDVTIDWENADRENDRQN